MSHKGTIFNETYYHVYINIGRSGGAAPIRQEVPLSPFRSKVRTDTVRANLERMGFNVEVVERTI